MHKFVFAGAAALALASCTAQAGPQPDQMAGPAPSSLPVGTCINLGNTLEVGAEASWNEDLVREADLKRIAAAGFDTVRIPVRWDNHSLDHPPYSVDPKWMARVEQVVDWALDADLNVILNSHHFNPIYADPMGAAEWHAGVWKQIAGIFADRPRDRLWFELENEPHDKFDHSNLLAALTPSLEAVRETNPNRPVIIGGEKWSGIDSLATLPLPDDPYVYPTFHYYDPFAFTHQGASWTAPNIPEPGRTFGTDEDREMLRRDVAKVEAYVERTGKVPFMGETGAYDKHIPTAERAAYHRAVREAFAPTGIGICEWAYANTFPFYDRDKGEWLPGMLESVGLKP